MNEPMRPNSKFVHPISPTLLENATATEVPIVLPADRHDRKSIRSSAIFSALASPIQANVPVLSSTELERLSVEYAQTRDEHLRDLLVLGHQKLVRSVASRFVSTSETVDDLAQVGTIGLINALDRFDPAQGNRFSTFAIPTILGVIKRHFRDKTADIKVPRALYERYFAVQRITQQLAQELGYTPTTAEIASRSKLTEAEVTAAFTCGQAVNTVSLDSHLALDSETLLDRVGEIDRTLTEFEKYGDLRKAIAALSDREQELLRLRYFEELSQARIGQHLGISQMHVSRLQQRALNRLREMLSDDIQAVGAARNTRGAMKTQREKP